SVVRTHHAPPGRRQEEDDPGAERAPSRDARHQVGWFTVPDERMIARSRSMGEKMHHRIDEGLALLEHRQVACAIQYGDARARNRSMKCVRISGWNQSVRRAPQDERRDLDAVNSLLQTFVRDWPKELPRGSETAVRLEREVGILELREQRFP